MSSSAQIAVRLVSAIAAASAWSSLSRLLGDDRGRDLDLLGIAALDPGIHDAEHRVADLEIGDAGAERALTMPEKSRPENVWEFQVAGAAIGAAAEPHLVVGGVDAGGMDIDHDLARARDRVRQVAVDEFVRPAVAGQIGGFHASLPVVVITARGKRGSRAKRRELSVLDSRLRVE